MTPKKSQIMLTIFSTIALKLVKKLSTLKNVYYISSGFYNSFMQRELAITLFTLSMSPTILSTKNCVI